MLYWSQVANNRQHNNRDRTNNKNIFIAVPYTRGLGEKLRKTCSTLIGIWVHFKGNNTIHTLLVAQKTRTPFSKKWASVEEYIGNQEGHLAIKLREHLIPPFTIYQHGQMTGHPFDMDCFTIVDRQEYSIMRTIKEAMFLHVNDPSLDRNQGKTNSPTSGMRFCRTPSHSTSSNLVQPLHLNGPVLLPIAHTFFILVSMVLTLWGCQFPPFPLLVPVYIIH